MHRIDGTNNYNNTFVDTHPVTGGATEVTDDIMNALQEEIANVIEASGATLVKANNSQLLASISTLANNVVNSVAALRALPSEPEGLFYTTLGYYSAGDGGGANYYWDEESTATDDGGSVIKITSVTTGRFILKFSQDVGLKQFGCKGDWNGSSGTDDTVAFQNAIDFIGVAGASYPAKLTANYGAFKITDTLDFSGWSAYYIPYVLDMSGTSIIAVGLNAKPALKFVSTENLTIRNLNLDSSGGTNDAGILIDGTASLTQGSDVGTFENITTRNFATHFKLGSAADRRVSFCKFSSITSFTGGTAFQLNGLVDRCNFLNIITSGMTVAGFHIPSGGTGACNYIACSGYGDYPLHLIEGAPNETNIIGGQNETNGPTTNYYFIKRTATGSATFARALNVIGCTIDAPVLLGSGSTGGIIQTNFDGCGFNANLDVSFSDYTVLLNNCTFGSGKTITVSGSASKIIATNCKLGAVTLSGSNSRLVSEESSYGTITTSGSGSKHIDKTGSGTFTPTYYGNTTAGTTTYVTQSGTWVRNGSVIDFQFDVEWSAATGTGDAKIGGIPFAPSVTCAVTLAYVSAIGAVTTSPIVARLDASSTVITISYVPGANSLPIDTDGGRIVASGRIIQGY